MPHGRHTDDARSIVRFVARGEVHGRPVFFGGCFIALGCLRSRGKQIRADHSSGRTHILSYHIVLEGSGWASVRGSACGQFAAGDVLVFPHSDPYAIVSTRDQAPELDEAETLNFFRDMAAGKLPFVVQEGGGGPERARFVCGFLGCDTRPFNPLICTLPKLLHIHGALSPANDCSID